MCSICLEDNDLQLYTLPECNHTFHTNCILAWFRKGKKACPLCKDEGVIEESTVDRLMLLLAMSETKHAPDVLKDTVSEYLLTSCEISRLKEKLHRSIDKFKESTKKKRVKIRTHTKRLKVLQRNILSYNIDRVIIPVKKILYYDPDNSHDVNPTAVDP